VTQSPAGRLTLRTVRHGAETITLPQRRVRIEPDVYVVAAGLQTFAWPIETDTRPLVVEFAIPDDANATSLDFLPTLRSIDGEVGRRLLEIGRSEPGAGRVLPSAESAALLWSELVAEERALRARAERIDCTKPSTRQALFRRLLLSADFIHSNYAEPLRVDALAERLDVIHRKRFPLHVPSSRGRVLCGRQRQNIRRASGSPLPARLPGISECRP